MIHIFKAITLPRSPRRNCYTMATTSESLRRRRYGTTSATRPLRHDRCSTTIPPQSLCFDRGGAADTIRPARYDQHDMTAPLQSPRHGSYDAIHFLSVRNVSSSVWPERHAARTSCDSPACGLNNMRVGQLEDRAACESPAFGSSDMRVDQHSGQATCRSSGTKIKGHATRTPCRSNVTRLTQHMNRTAYELARKWRNGARLQKMTTLLAENERRGPRYPRTGSNPWTTTHL